MNEWKQLGLLLAENDPDAVRLRSLASQPTAPEQGTPVVDPLLLEYWARKAGYRGQFGIHPDMVKGAPGLQLHFEDDTPIKK